MTLLEVEPARGKLRWDLPRENERDTAYLTCAELWRLKFHTVSYGRQRPSYRTVQLRPSLAVIAPALLVPLHPAIDLVLTDPILAVV